MVLMVTMRLKDAADDDDEVGVCVWMDGDDEPIGLAVLISIMSRYLFVILLLYRSFSLFPF